MAERNAPCGRGCRAPICQPVLQSASCKGDKGQHSAVGGGEVLEVENDNVLVAFSKGGQKRLRAGFLQLSISPTATLGGGSDHAV